jgi:hypothetical protein
MSAAEKEMDAHGDHEKVAVDAPPPDLVKHIDEKILKHSHDADAAMKAFEGYEGQTLELSEETSRRLLRKIDLHLMPVRLSVSLRCCMCVGMYSTCARSHM